ncbi:spore germination protein [Pseudalkalibacillus sp. R45]|uniref:spore germination protein n=1 Tax=Pseudalkalibacillus sp. R45 TaxID=3457433 RepID=UPI003FCD8F13
MSLKIRKRRENKQTNEKQDQKKTLLSSDLKQNEQSLKEIFSDCYDVIYHSYQFSEDYKAHAVVVFCETIVQNEKANLLKEVMQVLVTHEVGPAKEVDISKVKEFFTHYGVTSRAVKVVDTLEKMTDKILEGHFVILFDHWHKVLTYDAFAVEKRSVGEPQNEVAVVGPREGTIENLTKNIGMIRSRLKSKNLKFKNKKFGNETKTNVTYAYLDGTVPEDTLEEFEKRFYEIDQEEVIETSCWPYCKGWY